MAADVGSFGDTGVFMHYVAASHRMFIPFSDHPYAPAGILGAVSLGKMQMLESLSELDEKVFNLFAIAEFIF